MKESGQSFDVESLIDRARSLWCEASARVGKGHLELYTKTSSRVRATRSPDKTLVTIDNALESGLAVRTFEAGTEHAGFAASTGLSLDSVRRALDAADRWRGLASTAAPDARESIENERRDLDPEMPLPTAEELTAGTVATPEAEWIEAGITVEVLVGSGGWVTVRRRNRSWAVAGGAGSRLLARRGFMKWNELMGDTVSHPKLPDSRPLTLLAGAAAVVVAALVAYSHGADSAEWAAAGPGWEVDDQPANPLGLVGGSFDDAGFPTSSRILARSGTWVGALRGPGTFRRGSFREPPVEQSSNLVMSAVGGGPVHGRIANRCNLLRLSADIWVLELDFVDGDKRWVRTTPQKLLTACCGRMGVSETTPFGPIVPAIQFEGLALT